MTKPGFIHLTWWEHPDEPGWYNEVSMWASKEAVDDWHMDTYHKHAKEWAANGAIMEDIITNFELTGDATAPDLPDLRHAAGQGLRPGGRAEDAGRALSQVRLQLPGGQGDGQQHRGLQGRDDLDFVALGESGPAGSLQRRTASVDGSPSDKLRSYGQDCSA